jgi:MscS family membrane protein
MIEIVHATGIVFSGPGQVLQVRDFHSAPEDTLADVASQLERWQSEERSPFPDFSDAEKARLAAAIRLPSRSGT